jgi:hypothetical protein
MEFLPRSAIRVTCAWAGLGFAWLCVVTCASAEEFSWDCVGARFGFGANESARDFYETEVFSDINMPFHWKVGRSFQVLTKLDVGLGRLGYRSDNAVVGEAGPLFVLTYKDFPVTLGAGSNCTGLSRSDFETKDLGIQFQFTTHIGVYWDFARHFRAGYRYQHISNAGLSDHNPGLNMHVFGLSYLF